MFDERIMGSPRPSSSDDVDAVGDKDNSKSTEYNIFRDSLLRYCGYANEVGESFRYQFPRWVGPTYGIAFGYCLADAVSSGYTAYHHQQQQNDITFPRTTTATALAQAIVQAFDLS